MRTPREASSEPLDSFSRLLIHTQSRDPYSVCVGYLCFLATLEISALHLCTAIPSLNVPYPGLLNLGKLAFPLGAEGMPISLVFFVVLAGHQDLKHPPTSVWQVRSPFVSQG